jgi:predicted RNA-binding Zn-ribbon protein involved in translation (DUF1610 family)
MSTVSRLVISGRVKGFGRSADAVHVSAEATAVSCPRCGSTVRRGSDWCTLCFADLRPVPPPRVSPEPMQLHTASTGTTALAPDVVLLEPRVTDDVAASGTKAPVAIACSSCGEPVSLEVAVCGACGTGLFDRLKVDQATLVVPVVGDLMRFGKGAKAGIAIGFAVLFIVVLFTVITVLGHIF